MIGHLSTLSETWHDSLSQSDDARLICTWWLDSDAKYYEYYYKYYGCLLFKCVRLTGTCSWLKSSDNPGNHRM